MKLACGCGHRYGQAGRNWATWRQVKCIGPFLHLRLPWQQRCRRATAIAALWPARCAEQRVAMRPKINLAAMITAAPEVLSCGGCSPAPGAAFKWLLLQRASPSGRSGTRHQPARQPRRPHCHADCARLRGGCCCWPAPAAGASIKIRPYCTCFDTLTCTPPHGFSCLKSCNSQPGFLELTLLLAARSAVGSRIPRCFRLLAACFLSI
eukprot:COSAG01_NODE_15783_length_1300_cov_1.584513_1_plen_208_part_00